MCVLGKSFRKACFRCMECNTPLILSSYFDHKKEAYCKGCHQRLAGPSGFRKGVMNSFPSAREVPVKEAAAAAKRAAEEEAIRRAAEKESARVAAEQEAARSLRSRRRPGHLRRRRRPG